MNATRIGQRYFRSTPLFRLTSILLAILVLSSTLPVSVVQGQDSSLQDTQNLCKGKDDSECTEYITLEAAELGAEDLASELRIFVRRADTQLIIYVNGKKEYDSGITTGNPLIGVDVPIRDRLISGRNVIDVVGVNLAGAYHFDFDLITVDGSQNYVRRADSGVGIRFHQGFVIDVPLAPNRPDLVLDPIPRAPQNLRFCRIDPAPGDLRLIVSITNKGLADAPASITEVRFSGGGIFPLQTPRIPQGSTINLQSIPIPRTCWSPDCGFTITLDSTRLIDEMDEENNLGVGQCVG